MPSPIWLGTTTAFATASNWSTGVAPVDADIITFNGLATQGVVGSDQSAIEPAILNFYMSFAYTCGTSTTALSIGPVICNIGLPSDDGSSPSGPSQLFLNFGTDVVACTVHDARSQGVAGFPCIVLEGVNIANTLIVKGGSVGLGVFTPGIAATFLSVALLGPTVNMVIGTAVTLTTLSQSVNGGKCLLQSSVTTLDQDGGEIETRGSGAITTAFIKGKARLNSTGTITALTVAGNGLADFSRNSAARTVSALTLDGTAATVDLRNTNNSVTLSAGIVLQNGASANQILCDDRTKVWLSVTTHTTGPTA